MPGKALLYDNVVVVNPSRFAGNEEQDQNLFLLSVP
jgi:hypothetical protein